MSSESSRPSEQLLLQRVRNQLIDYLEVAASFSAQLRYQEQSPQLQVSLEIIEQWADWVGPEWQRQFIAPVFSPAEQAAVAAYQRQWSELQKVLPQPLPPLVDLHKDPVWQALRQAASEAFACFARVGKLSETVEYHLTNAENRDISTFGVLIYAKDLQGLSQFYSEVLGLALDQQQSQEEHGLLALRGRSICLLVHAIPAAYAEDIVITRPPQVREDTPIKFFCEVHQLEYCINMLVQAGGLQLGPVWQTEHYDYCDVVDPEGNVFQIRQARSHNQLG